MEFDGKGKIVIDYTSLKCIIRMAKAKKEEDFRPEFVEELLLLNHSRHTHLVFGNYSYSNSSFIPSNIDKLLRVTDICFAKMRGFVGQSFFGEGKPSGNGRAELYEASGVPIFGQTNHYSPTPVERFFTFETLDYSAHQTVTDNWENYNGSIQVCADGRFMGSSGSSHSTYYTQVKLLRQRIEVCHISLSSTNSEYI